MTPLPDSSPPPARSATAWWLTYGVLVVFLLSLGLAAALQFNGEPIDGPFQLYNALRRINAGQRGGIDFQFFHGLAIPYLHYPLFRLFGGGFTGSELARQVITTLSGPVALLLFFRAYLDDWRRSVQWAITVLALTIVLRLWPLTLTVNSLLALRSAVALLVPIVWVLPMRRRPRAMLIGVALGAALLLGTEQGLAVIAAYTIVAGGLAIARREREAWLDLLIAFATMTVVVLGFLSFVGGWTGAMGALRYNLKLVPMDQYWYFGVPPNAFIGRWGRLLPSLAAQPWIPIALIIGGATGVLAVRGLMGNPADRRRSGIALLAVYGLISCASLLGILLISYVEPLLRVALLIGALWVDGWIKRQRETAAGWRTRIEPGTIAIAACLLIPVTNFPITRAAGGSLATVLGHHAARGVGMELSPSWQATLRAGQRVVSATRGPERQTPSIWSTYSGLLEAENGVFHPSTDYIIHALGPDARAKYVEAFRSSRPTIAQTMLPTLNPYETWIEQTSWDFYDTLIRHYRVVGNSEWSIFWQRTTDSLPEPVAFWNGRTDGTDRVQFTVAAADSSLRLIEVTIRYRARNAMRALPIIGSMPRYLVLTGGAITKPPVTLDPYVQVDRFPLVVRPGAKIELAFETYSLLPGARIDVESVSAAAYAPAATSRPWLINFACAGFPESVRECR